MMSGLDTILEGGKVRLIFAHQQTDGFIDDFRHGQVAGGGLARSRPDVWREVK